MLLLTMPPARSMSDARPSTAAMIKAGIAVIHIETMPMSAVSSPNAPAKALYDDTAGADPCCCQRTAWIEMPSTTTANRAWKERVMSVASMVVCVVLYCCTQLMVSSGQLMLLWIVRCRGLGGIGDLLAR